MNLLLTIILNFIGPLIQNPIWNNGCQQHHCLKKPIKGIEDTMVLANEIIYTP